MYHVTGTGITILILYTVSYLFFRIGYFSESLHKKLWNSILAVAFLFSAAAGLFIALQISYKWNIPNVKTILRWHVEFGIGMAITGLLHLIWHISYFKKLFRPVEPGDTAEAVNINKREWIEGIRTNLFVTGFVSSSFQFLLIREMMNISGGFELIAGIFLGTWLIISAAGSAIAGRSLLTNLRRINLIFLVSIVISLLLMFLLARLFLENGETPSVLESLVFTLLVLIPLCLSSGFTFVKLLLIARESKSINPGKSFSIETAGGIIAGIVLSILIAGSLGTYKILIVIILLYAAYTTLAFCKTKAGINFALRLMFTIFAAVIILMEPDVIFRQIMLPGIKIIESEDTPYGNITKAEYNGESSVYYNQRLLKYSDDVIEREENVHYAMLQHESPESVIQISGSFDTHLPEILKYKVNRIIYIERDPALAKTEIADTLKSMIKVSDSDAFRYIRESGDRADVILLLLPPPSTLQLNRFYTTEFFQAIRNKLNSGGVFLCSPGEGSTYINDESLSLNSSVFNSLKSVFQNVIPVAGNKLYFIASENPLSTSFCALTERRKINNLYVSADYLSDDLIERKSLEIMKLLDTEMKQNTSTFPIAYNYYQSYYFSKSPNEKRVVIFLIAILFALPLMFVKRENLVMYFSASALAGFEIIALMTLQLIIGNMYQMTGLIIAGLMAGLAAGSGRDYPRFSVITSGKKALMMFFFYIGISLLYPIILMIHGSFFTVCLILLMSFIPAFITGSIFRDLTLKGGDRSKSARVYTADLSGSALGFIAVSGIVIPAFGTVFALYFLAALVFTGFLLGTVSYKH